MRANLDDELTQEDAELYDKFIARMKNMREQTIRIGDPVKVVKEGRHRQAEATAERIVKYMSMEHQELLLFMTGLQKRSLGDEANSCSW